ncbi:hypothetical protein [Actinoplanes sp. NPDC023714]|uniref:hypothetical protein n=1 Tax=Actinoplanes sp. NPDC023714 TaxID=3154322 RepID=UPI0033ED52AB
MRRDAGHIEANLPGMEEAAALLAAAVERDYAPRAVTVSAAMRTPMPPADRGFSELHLFAHAHEQAQQATLANVLHFANGTAGLAAAAREAGSRYAESDATARDLLRRA